VRVLGLDLPPGASRSRPGSSTLALLDASGRVARLHTAPSIAAAAAAVAEWSVGEPFLLGVNVPVVVPARPARVRPVEHLVRRRLGFRLPPGGRGAGDAGLAGEALLASLAACGAPCLPYPDRDRRHPGLAETYPALTLKVLLWEASSFAGAARQEEREALFRATSPSPQGTPRARSGWAERAVRLDLLLRALAGAQGYDPTPARDALVRADCDADVDRAAGALDAALIAGTTRRYLEQPETCVFLGDRETGYVVLPADALVRRLALRGTTQPRGQLFPPASLAQRLGALVQLRSMDLLSVPGRPQRTEAVFREVPLYEFDNVDEMLWWKHCRHVSGPTLPTEGLQELTVDLDPAEAGAEAAPLKLLRSRHRTLSFRFEPPAVWRSRVPTRDGRTYAFHVRRVVYETLPAR
jgi:predicted RNase H-like nuclease